MCWQQKQQVVSFPLCLTQKVLSARFAKNKFTNSFIHQNSLEATEMMNAMSYFYFAHHSIRLPVGWMCHVWPTQHNDCYCFCCSRSMNPSFTAKTLLSWSVLCDTTVWHSRHIPSNFALFLLRSRARIRDTSCLFCWSHKILYLHPPTDPNTYLTFITTCITSTVPGNRARIRFPLSFWPLIHCGGTTLKRKQRNFCWSLQP